MDVLKTEFPNCQDLIKNPRVLKQHLYGHKLGLLSNFFIVSFLGLCFNDFWGYLLIGGFFRIVCVHQVTFSINSIAHMFGDTPHSEEHTAKDSFYCAILTFGGILAAYINAQKTGKGQKLETSLVGSAFRLLGWTMTTAMWSNKPPITGARINGTRERPGIAACRRSEAHEAS